MEHKHINRIATAAFALMFTTAYAGSNSADGTYLRIDGSNTVGANLAPTLAVAFFQFRGMAQTSRTGTGDGSTRVRATADDGDSWLIEINAKGSSTAFKALAEGTGDIGASSRPVKDGEWEALSAKADLRSHQSEHVLGLDGIAVIVHPSNPLRSLDKEQVRSIFGGQVLDWSAVGGLPGPIRIYARDENSGTFDTFRSLVMGKATPLRADAVRFESNDKLSDSAASDPASIGFAGLPSVRDARALAISDGGAAVLPTPFSVATEDYPLSRRLYLYNLPSPGNLAMEEFIEFSLSAQGQDVLRSVGFVSQNLTANDVALPEDAPADYREVVKGAQRLSANLRFEARSYRLDNKAKRDVQRIVDYMQSSENGARQLLLLGFSDRSESTPMVSLVLSENRAMTVDRVLQQEGLLPVSVRGFGSALPVADSSTEMGKERNRRVEVWVR